MNIIVLLEAADGTYCILAKKDSLLYPSAEGQALPGEIPTEAASRLLCASIGVVCPPQKFRTISPSDSFYIVATARYNVTMGPFMLDAAYTDDNWLDREELRESYTKDPAAFSPSLEKALEILLKRENPLCCLAFQSFRS